MYLSASLVIRHLSLTPPLAYQTSPRAKSMTNGEVTQQPPFQEVFYRNEIWVGLLFGLLLPLCSFVLLFEIFNLLETKGAASGAGFSLNFRERTLAIVAIALNILPMNMYKKRRWDLSMRGVVIATALLAFVWVVRYGVALF